MKQQKVFTQTFGVTAGVIEKDSKILLVKEGDPNKYDFGKWQLPCGWLNVEESPIDGVKREVKEETGCDFTPTHFLGVYSLVRSDARDQHNGWAPHPIKIVFIGTIDESTRAELYHDVSENGWFTQEEINAMGQDTLRDIDVKTIVNDYFEGKRFPLEAVTHTVQEKPHQSGDFSRSLS